MAKKKKIDVDVQINDTHVEIKRDEKESKVLLDSNKLDIEVTKTEDSLEVKVEAQNPFLGFAGKILGRYISKKLK
jgi:hypothetical protein